MSDKTRELIAAINRLSAAIEDYNLRWLGVYGGSGQGFKPQPWQGCPRCGTIGDHTCLHWTTESQT